MRRKQASSHVPKGKGRQNSEREVLRESVGHQQSPEPHFIFLRTIMHAAAVAPRRPVVWLVWGRLMKVGAPRLPLSMWSPASKWNWISSAQS